MAGREGDARKIILFLWESCGFGWRRRCCSSGVGDGKKKITSLLGSCFCLESRTISRTLTSSHRWSLGSPSIRQDVASG